MADKELAAEGGTGKKSSAKVLIILIAAAVLLLGGGTAAFLLLRGGAEPAAADPPPTARNQQPSATVGPMVDIEPFIINILDDNGTRYLKAAITLEMNSPAAVDETRLRMPQIQDAILLLVGNKTFGELADLHGKLQLRSELRERLNKILANGQVEKIYFTEFVVQ